MAGNLLRDYDCTRCGTRTNGIPFGPVMAEWCADCHFEVGPVLAVPEADDDEDAPDVEALVSALATTGDYDISTKSIEAALEDVRGHISGLDDEIADLESDQDDLRGLESDLEDALALTKPARAVRKAA